MKSHEVRPYIDSDAADVATLFNESNDAWPGGFTQGKNLTDDDVRKWMEHMEKVEVYVAVADGHARGYCSLIRSITEEKDTVYVGLLGATPKYHGRGLGRDLLRACVKKAIDERIRRVDLHTWAGNLKAVPLYKKTGFFWVPQTSVFMQNFIPLIVNTPFVSDFFKDTDWYHIHDRKLELIEDFEEWEGMKVYTYRFKRDNSRFEVKINSYARQIAFFENDKIRIALKPPKERPLRGRSMVASLEINKKDGVDESLTIEGYGKNGITCAMREQLVIGNSASIEIPFLIEQRTRKGDDYNPYPAIGASVAIDGKSIDLAIGLDSKSSVDISVSPQFPIFIPNRKSSVKIELTNNSEKSLRGKLAIPILDKLKSGETNSSFDIPSDGKKSVDFSLSIQESSILPVACEYEMSDGEHGTTAPTDIPFLVDYPDKPSGVEYTENEFNLPAARVFREGYLLDAISRGGRVSFVNAIDGEQLIRHSYTAFGPPYSPSVMEYTSYKIRVLPDYGIELSATVDKDPSVEHVLVMRIIGRGLLELVHTIKNQGGDKGNFGIKSSIRPYLNWANMKFVHKKRIISGMMVHDGYPVHGEMSEDRKDYDEGWISAENPSIVKGFMFADDIRHITRAWGGTSFEWRFDKLPAKTSTSTKPFYIYAGSGTWRDIRELWWRLVERHHNRPPEIEIRPIRRLLTVPAIPCVSDRTECTIEMTSERLVPAEGVIKLSTDRNIKINKRKFKCQNVKRDEPFSGKFTISNHTGNVGASALQMRFDGRAGSVESESLILTVDPRAKTEIRKEGSEWIISNGLATIKADPDWGGGIHSFTALGREFLKHPYPDKKAMFSWFNPWRGGIIPAVSKDDDWFSYPHIESWTISECSEEIGGLDFTGVAIRTTIEKQERLKGCGITAKFMLSDGHRIMKIVTEYENLTDITYRALGKMDFFLDVHPENKTLQLYDYGNTETRLAGLFVSFHPTSGWLITENQDTNESLIVVMKSTGPLFPHRDTLWVADFDIQYGQHTGSSAVLELAPHEKRTIVHYMVPCRNRVEAKLMRHLSEL